MAIEFYDVKKREKVQIPESEVKKTTYERQGKDGKTQVRYAFRAVNEGTKLTKFASKDDWDALDAPIEQRWPEQHRGPTGSRLGTRLLGAFVLAVLAALLPECVQRRRKDYEHRDHIGDPEVPVPEVGERDRGTHRWRVWHPWWPLRIRLRQQEQPEAGEAHHHREHEVLRAGC